MCGVISVRLKSTIPNYKGIHMISAYWLIAAFICGALVGVFFIALLVGGRD